MYRIFPKIILLNFFLTLAFLFQGFCSEFKFLSPTSVLPQDTVSFAIPDDTGRFQYSGGHYSIAATRDGTPNPSRWRFLPLFRNHPNLSVNQSLIIESHGNYKNGRHTNNPSELLLMIRLPMESLQVSENFQQLLGEIRGTQAYRNKKIVIPEKEENYKNLHVTISGGLQKKIPNIQESIHQTFKDFGSFEIMGQGVYIGTLVPGRGYLQIHCEARNGETLIKKIQDRLGLQDEPKSFLSGFLYLVDHLTEEEASEFFKIWEDYRSKPFFHSTVSHLELVKINDDLLQDNPFFEKIALNTPNTSQKVITPLSHWENTDNVRQALLNEALKKGESHISLGGPSANVDNGRMKPCYGASLCTFVSPQEQTALLIFLVETQKELVQKLGTDLILVPPLFFTEPPVQDVWKKIYDFQTKMQNPFSGELLPSYLALILEALRNPEKHPLPEGLRSSLHMTIQNVVDNTEAFPPNNILEEKRRVLAYHTIDKSSPPIAGIFKGPYWDKDFAFVMAFEGDHAKLQSLKDLASEAFGHKQQNRFFHLTLAYPKSSIFSLSEFDAMNQRFIENFSLSNRIHTSPPVFWEEIEINNYGDSAFQNMQFPVMPIHLRSPINETRLSKNSTSSSG
jgi:hypothetical protein